MDLNKDKTKVSIVIPCYNDYKFVAEAVQSALDQTYPNKEIIVVDDGSDLRTKKVLKELESKIDLIISQENRGTSSARNKGIEMAMGDFILVLDSDDFYENSFCQKAIKIFDKDPDIKIVTSYARWFKDEKDFTLFKPPGGKLQNYLINNCALGTIFKKTDWEKAGGYDEEMQGFEDWEFYIRLHREYGYTFVIPEVLFNYRNRPLSRNSLANRKKYELLKYLYLKHQDLYTQHYELFIEEIIKKLIIQENRTEREKNKIEYRIGQTVLKPIRFIKSIFN